MNKRLIKFPLLAAALLLAPVALSAQATPTNSRTIALTFDDLPMTVIGNDHIAGDLKTTRDVNQKILQQLTAHHATAIGFVNEVKLNVLGERDARAALVEDWLSAGMLLGNHGYQHLEFNTVSLETYEEELVRGETITAAMLSRHGLQQRYFRHPYLDTGDTAAKKDGFAAFLNAHHYLIAPVTVQNEDWMFNAPYAQAKQRGDIVAVERIRQAYLDHTYQALDAVKALSLDTFHREIPQVLLLHAVVINADNLAAVLDLMQQSGYGFISLDDALADPAYRTSDNYVGSDGISWLDRWQLALGHPMHPTEPSPPKWVEQQYTEITSPGRP